MVIRIQHVNFGVVRRLANYAKVIVLTARDVNDYGATKHQLVLVGVHFDRIICCPRKQLSSRWKISLVQKLVVQYKRDVEGFGDEVGGSISAEALKVDRFHIRPLRPRQF
jgi:hypothetical protein